MRFVSVAMREQVIFKILCNAPGCCTQSQENISGGETFCSYENVGFDIPVVNGKPLSGTSPSAHDFIGNQEHTMTVANVTQTRQIFWRRNQNTVRTHDWFDYH